MGFYTTSAHPSAVVMLKAGDKVLLQEKVAIDPGKPYTKQVAVPAGTDEHDLVASISANGRELVSYSPVRLTPEPLPQGTTRPPAPAGCQNHRGTLPDRSPRPAVPRPRHRSRCPTGKRLCAAIRATLASTPILGITAYRKARYDEAEKYLAKAIERLTGRVHDTEGCRADLLPRRHTEGVRQDQHSLHEPLQGHVEQSLEIACLLFSG